MIPDGWKESTVGKSYNICNNLRFPINLEDRKGMQGIYPYYGPTGILNFIDEYRLDGEYALIGEDGDHFLKYNNKSMTLLVNGKINVNNHAHIIQGSVNCRTDWFYYYFMNRPLTPYLTRQGAGRYKLTKSALENIPILIPPFSEQCRIAEILGVWDESIDLLEKLIGKTRSRKQGLMQQLLTGKNKVNILTGKESQFFGTIPSHWEEKNFSDVFELVSRKNSAKVPNVLTISSRNGFVTQEDRFSKVIAGANLENYTLLRKGEFAYNKGNSKSYECGCIFLMEEYQEAAIPNVYICFRSKIEVNEFYYKFFFRADLLKKQLRRIINSGVRNDGLLNLKTEEFLQMKVLLPPLPEIGRASCRERV